MAEGPGKCLCLGDETQRQDSLSALQEVVGKNILKVEPLNAILDPHYFVRAVHECVLAWLGTLNKPEMQGEQIASIRQAPPFVIHILAMSCLS